MTKTRTTKRPARQKVSRSLAGFADAQKSNVELMRDIQVHVVAEGAKNSNREDHKIHVSEVVKDNTCPRMLFYKVSEAERTDTAPSAGARMEMIWAAGNAEHEKWQGWLQEMGLLWGNWKCGNCAYVVSNAEQPHACRECHSMSWIYDEAHLEVEPYHLVGHSDGAVPTRETLVEVKSFSMGTVRMENPTLLKDHTYTVQGKQLVDHDGLWKSLTRPLTSHLRQGMMYLWMCKQMGLPYERILFIYENKTTQATKSFDVKFSDRIIRDAIKTLEDVEVYRAEGIAPPRPALFDKGSKPCKDCVFKTLCWESDADEKDRDSAETGTEVPPRRSRKRGSTAGGETEVRPARPSRNRDAAGAGRRDRPGRPGAGEPDDGPDSVGRAPRRSVGSGRGGRAVGGRSAGQGEGPRFTRRDRG